MVLLLSCTQGSPQTPPLGIPGATATRKQLAIEVDGVGSFTGIAILPSAQATYKIKFQAKEDPEYIAVTSCQRDQRVKPSGDKWWINYQPGKFEAGAWSCPLNIAALDDDKGRHEYGSVYFNRGETLEAIIVCQEDSSNVTGLSVCQNRTGLLTALGFDQPIAQVTTLPETCEKPIHLEPAQATLVFAKPQTRHWYTYKISEGICLYLFAAGGKVHRHISDAYTDEQE